MMNDLRTWTVVFCAAAMLGLAPGCSQDTGAEEEEAGGPPERPPPGVRVVVAEISAIEDTVQITGEYLAEQVVELAAIESGRLQSISVDEGDHVVAEQVIAVLDADTQSRNRSEARARVDTAEARLSQARAELEIDERELNRRSVLVDRGAFPQAEFEVLQDELEVQAHSVGLAEAQLEEAEAASSSLRVSIERREVHAPFDGLVVQRHRHPGDVVSASTSILTLVDEASMRFVVRLSERSVGLAPVGTPARVTFDARPGESFDAVVEEHGHIVDRDSRTIEVDLRFTNPADDLRHGMFGRGELILERTEGMVVLPNEAIQTRADGVPAVWTVTDGVATEHEVTLVTSTERSAAVEGISAGDWVVITPLRGVESGVQVHVVNIDEVSGEADVPAASGDAPQ